MINELIQLLTNGQIERTTNNIVALDDAGRSLIATYRELATAANTAAAALGEVIELQKQIRD